MRQLALETSGTSGSVALLDEVRLVAELALPAGERSGRSLGPAIAQLLRHVGWKPTEIDLVSVTAGPGSFTGLRIGVTTAKAFAYAAGADVLAVDTLDVLAEQAGQDWSQLEVVLGAERGQLFWGSYEPSGGAIPRRPEAMRLVDQEEWLASLNPGTSVTGPPIEKLASRIPGGIRLVPADRRFPLATTVGLLAARKFAAGERGDLWKLVPLYGRPSAAEEKWNAKRGS